MITLEFLRAPVWQGLTWTLLHFLWQGLAVAVVLMLLLWLCGLQRSRIRYLLCMGGLGAMVLCPIVTFFVLADDMDWGTADFGTGQARSISTAEVTVDFGPGLPLEPMMDTFEAPNSIATRPQPAAAASEPRLWDRLGEYGRDAQPYLLAAWVLGVVCLSARLLLGVVAARCLRRAREAIPPQLTDSVTRLSRAIGLRRTARVCVSPRIREAMVVGILRPMVLLPVAWATEMTPEILEAIIAHELAHIRRWDLWATLLQRLVETLLFYHPAVWWISRRVSSEREKCCDELAVAATGRRVTYAKALEQAAAIRLAPTASALGAAFGGRKMAILDRVSHILGMSATRKNQRARWWPVGLMVLLMLVGIYRVAFETPSAVLAEEKAVATPLQSNAQSTKTRKNADATLIRGTVVDQQGKPIAGARLWYVYAFDKSSGKRLEVDTRSNATGQFTLEIPPVPVEKKGFIKKTHTCVWAYSPKHCLGSVSLRSKQASQDPADIHLELSPATDTSLVVLDPDGQPMAGVLVEPINYLTQIGYELIPDGTKPFVGGRSDAEGRVRLPAMARDHLLNVWLTTDNYGVQCQQFTVKASEPAERTIHLRPVCRLEGRVIAEKPEWATGKRFLFTTGYPAPWSTEGNADVTTDEDGRFVVPIIAEGQLRMQHAVLDDKLPVRPEQPSFVKLSAGNTTVLEIPMRRLVDIRGSILAKDTGKPLPGIEIHIYYGGFRQGTDVVSDANGQFSASVLPGKISFQPQSLSKTKYLQLGEPQWYNVPDDANGFELPAIEVVPSKPLEGRLVDQDDSPVADAKVSASYSGWLCSTAPTSKDGRFTLPKMPVSVDPDKATYRVQLGIGETRDMRQGEVEIIKVDPFVLRVKQLEVAGVKIKKPTAEPSGKETSSKERDNRKLGDKRSSKRWKTEAMKDLPKLPAALNKMIVRGKVVDHTGQAVAGAGVYLGGSKEICLSEGPHNEFQQATVHTDADGRFVISGPGDESKAIVVNAPSLFVWRADLPELGQEAIIRLPQPAKLHIRYDIADGPSEAQVRIALRTWDMPKWKAAVEAIRWVYVKAGEDGLVVDNLPPGVYDIFRSKQIQSGSRGKGMMLDRQLKLTLTSGKTTEYNLVRKTGMPISGDIAGLPKEGVDGVFVYICDQRVSGDPRNHADWKLSKFDGLALDGNGHFTTERIPPGKYKVVAEAYRQEKPTKVFSTGWQLPKWTGTATVNVPESGEPPKVRVEMRPYDAKAKARQVESADAETETRDNPKAGKVEAADTHDEPTKEGKKAHATNSAKLYKNQTVSVKGVVVDENGQPVVGVSVRALVPGEREPTMKSDAQGRFELQVDRKRANGLAIVARSADGTRQAFFKRKAGVPQPPVRLTMQPARSIDVRVVDGKGKPVAVAEVGAVVYNNDIAMGLTNGQGEVTLRIPAAAPLQNIFALKSGLGLDYVAFNPKNEAIVEHPQVLTLSGAKTVRVKLLDPEGRPMVGIGVCPWIFEKKSRHHREPWNGLNISAVGIFQVKTDSDGVATFDWIPSWQTRDIAFWPRADKDNWVSKPIRVDLEDAKSEIKAQLVRTVVVRGQVQFANGQSAEGIQLRATGFGYQSNKYQGSTRTDADGRFEFRVSPDLLYMFAVVDSKWAARARSGIVVHRDTPINGVDFELFPATRVYGQVTVGADRKPLANEWVSLVQLGTDNLSLPEKEQLPIPPNINRRIRRVQPKISHGAITDENGNFEFHAGLGDYELHGPDQAPKQEFSLGKQKSRKIDLHAERPDRGIIVGKVVLKKEDSRTVADAEVVGVSMDGAGLSELFAKTDKQGRFRTERRLKRMAFFAKSTDGKFAGIAKISADDKEVTIPVEPAATAKGRLVDAASGLPLPGRNIDYSVRVNHLEPNGSRSGRWSVCSVGSVKTNAQGQFIATGLLVGAEHDFSIVLRDKANPPGSYVYRQITEVTPKNAEVLELGNLVLALPKHVATPSKASTPNGKRVDE